MSGSGPLYQRQVRTTGGGGIVRTPGPRLAPVQQEAVLEPARTVLPASGTMGALGTAMAGLGEILGQASGRLMEQATQERRAQLAADKQTAREQEVFAADEFARTVPLRDGDGNLVVPDQADPLTRAGRVQNAGVALRLTNDIVNRGGLDAVRLRAETPNDPAQFQARWTGYTEGVLQRVPAWVRPEAESTLARLGAEHARGVATEAMQTERRNQAQAAGMRQQDLERDLSGLAASGVTSGLEWDSTFGRYQAHLNDMVRTGQMTAEAATMLRDATMENTAAASAVRWGQEAARSGRPAEEVLGEFDGRMDTQRMPLQQRERMRNYVETSLREEDARRREARGEASIQADDWRARITAGIPVSADEGLRIATALERAAAPAQAADVRRLMAVQADAQLFRGMPTAQLAQTAERTALYAQTHPDATRLDGERADLAARMLAQRRASMNADPFATGAATYRATVGEVMPLDFTSPQALTAGLQQRERQAQQIGTREGRPIPALTAPEVIGLRTMLNEGTIDQQLVALTGMSQGLAPNTMARTLNMLVEGQDNAPRLQSFVVAAANATSRPAMAREVLQGMETIKQLNPRSVSGDEWRRVTIEQLGGASGPLMLRTDTMAQVGQAARALYVQRHMALDRPADVSSTLDTTKFTAIVREIMPTLTYGSWRTGNTQTIVSPRPGMTQTQFDEHMARIPPEALIGARATDGRPFTVEMMRGARLYSVDEGVYEVRYGGFQVNDGTGRPLRLNLREDWPARQQLGSVERRQRDDATFQQEFGPAAERVATRLGVPARTILAHWSLETNNGRAFAGNNNLGNMTALPSQDATEGGDRDGNGVPIRQRFLNFASLDAFADSYASWVERRAPDARGAGDARSYAAALARGRYATDPRFADSLAGVARRFGGQG